MRNVNQLSRRGFLRRGLILRQEVFAADQGLKSSDQEAETKLDRVPGTWTTQKESRP